MFAGRRRSGGVPDDYDEFEKESFVASVTGFRLTMLAACMLFLGGLLFSASRAGLAATLASSGVLAVLMLRGPWHSRPRLARLFVGGVIVVGLIVLAIAGNTIVDKMARASDGGDRIRIMVQGQQLAVVGGTFQEMLAVVKGLPGRQYDGQAKLWQIPGELGVIQGMIQAAGFTLEGAKNLPAGPVSPMEPLGFSGVSEPPPFEEPDFSIDDSAFPYEPPDWFDDEHLPPPPEPGDWENDVPSPPAPDT